MQKKSGYGESLWKSSSKPQLSRLKAFLIGAVVKGETISKLTTRTQTVCGRILSSPSHDADCLSSKSQADLPHILTSSTWAQILSAFSWTAFSPFTGLSLPP
jgi:hypothetical protein